MPCEHLFSELLTLYSACRVLLVVCAHALASPQLSRRASGGTEGHSHLLSPSLPSPTLHSSLPLHAMELEAPPAGGMRC